MENISKSALHNSLKSEFKNNLKIEPEIFWECLFNMVETYAETYIQRIDSYGVEKDFINYKIDKYSKTNNEALSSQEKVQALINPLKQVMIDLNSTYREEKSKLNDIEDYKQQLKEKTEKIKQYEIEKLEFEKNLQIKTEAVKQLEEEKAAIQAIASKTEEEVLNIKGQTLYELEDQIKDIRIFLSKIPRDIEKEGKEIPNKIKKRLNSGIQNAYIILNKAELWRYDDQPMEIVFDSSDIRPKRSKKSISNEITAPIEKIDEGDSQLINNTESEDTRQNEPVEITPKDSEQLSLIKTEEIEDITQVELSKQDQSRDEITSDQDPLEDANLSTKTVQGLEQQSLLLDTPFKDEKDVNGSDLMNEKLTKPSGE